MSSIRDFVVSRVRVKLLKIFLSSPAEMFYVRQLTRQAGEEINAVRRELSRMMRVGMVKSQKRGNRLYFWFNKQYRFYPELLRLVAKTTGLGAMVIKQQQKLGRLKYAILSGRLVRQMPHREDQVDLLLIGEIVMPQLQAMVKTEEKRIKQEINYSVMTEEEFKFRKTRRDPFITEVLTGSRIMLIGDEEELVL